MTEPFARWPDEVAFNGPELDAILGALDYALDLATEATGLRAIRRAQLVIWRKLWPELAEHYDDQEAGEEE